MFLLAREGVEKMPALRTYRCCFPSAEMLAQQGQASVILFLQVFPHLAGHAAKARLQQAGIKELNNKSKTC